MICKYGISPDACEALKAMGVNILEKVSHQKRCISMAKKLKHIIALTGIPKVCIKTR